MVLLQFVLEVGGLGEEYLEVAPHVDTKSLTPLSALESACSEVYISVDPYLLRPKNAESGENDLPLFDEYMPDHFEELERDPRHVLARAAQAGRHATIQLRLHFASPQESPMPASASIGQASSLVKG
jgi:glutamine synthetase